ncbi:MAG: SCO1664 family protein [Intrasporangium sp.]|uniref:SCO1664 family protein n=1 Tax=Intrasporangium sp. TaxID=1925024 RepID=UPI002649E972|nr:SCO1664 family protein [Intrasporangium sp.]MDN5794663.1 SCO1664 family protein [Intrasporangium sp.]
MATSAEPGDAQPTRPDDPDLTADLEVVGRVAQSSNRALLCRLAGTGHHVIYKPIRGERPLWDFPDGTLAGREVAAHLVSRLGGWDLVPPTILREGPLGPGSVQLWIGDPFDPVDDETVVSVVPAGRVPAGWLEVFDGETTTGQQVAVVHVDLPEVRSLAVLDAVLNNSDRKGSHCLRDDTGRLWAIDHGVCFHTEPKLRTVLWGWAGEPIPDGDLQRLARLEDALHLEALATALGILLPADDVLALGRRTRGLLRSRRHPQPSGGWPSVPWPPL